MKFQISKLHKIILLLTFSASFQYEGAEQILTTTYGEEGFVVQFFIIGEKELDNGELGTLKYNFFQLREEQCNGKSSRFVLYSKDRCINISSSLDDDYTIKRISEPQENLVFKITMKNGDKNDLGIPATTVLTLQCDSKKEDEPSNNIPLTPLSWDKETNTYYSLTLTNKACPNEFFSLLNNFLNIFRLYFGLFTSIIGVLAIIDFRDLSFEILFCTLSAFMSFIIGVVILSMTTTYKQLSTFLTSIILISFAVVGALVGLFLSRFNKVIYAIFNAVLFWNLFDLCLELFNLTAFSSTWYGTTTKLMFATSGFYFAFRYIFISDLIFNMYWSLTITHIGISNLLAEDFLVLLFSGKENFHNFSKRANWKVYLILSVLVCLSVPSMFIFTPISGFPLLVMVPSTPVWCMPVFMICLAKANSSIMCLLVVLKK